MVRAMALTFIILVELFPAWLWLTCHEISAATGKAGAIIRAFRFLYATQSPHEKETDAANGGGHLGPAWSRSDCYQWEGVRECLNERVTKLVVENLGLNGMFEDNMLSRLGQLRVLSLKANVLRGPIPDLSSLCNLKALFLNYNNFTSSFLASIMTLHRLKVIVLSHNSLEGQIPMALTLLLRLLVFSVENNRLSGTLPVFNQLSLRFLNVSYNWLSGPVLEMEILSVLNLSSFSGNLGLCRRFVDRPDTRFKSHMQQMVEDSSTSPSLTHRWRS